MRSRHCAAECRLDRWSSCIRSMSDLGQSAVLTVRRPLPAFPHKQTFSGSVGMSQWCQQETPCTGKIERGTAVIERPWIRFSEELPRNRLKQSGLSRPVAGLQEPTTHVGGDYALIVANRNRVLRFT